MGSLCWNPFFKQFGMKTPNKFIHFVREQDSCFETFFLLEQLGMSRWSNVASCSSDSRWAGRAECEQEALLQSWGEGAERSMQFDATEMYFKQGLKQQEFENYSVNTVSGERHSA